jgi:hypothetical protein
MAVINPAPALAVQIGRGLECRDDRQAAILAQLSVAGGVLDCSSDGTDPISFSVKADIGQLGTFFLWVLVLAGALCWGGQWEEFAIETTQRLSGKSDSRTTVRHCARGIFALSGLQLSIPKPQQVVS